MANMPYVFWQTPTHHVVLVTKPASAAIISDKCSRIALDKLFYHIIEQITCRMAVKIHTEYPPTGDNAADGKTGIAGTIYWSQIAINRKKCVNPTRALSQLWIRGVLLSQCLGIRIWAVQKNTHMGDTVRCCVPPYAYFAPIWHIPPQPHSEGRGRS